MVTKEWMKVVAAMTAAECHEMGKLLLSMKGKDVRDAGEEALLQDRINSLPSPPDNGLASALHHARLAAGRCCKCGLTPMNSTSTKER